VTPISKVVVPLDGGPEHQTAIAVAAQLAATTRARLELVTVASRGMVSYDSTELEGIASELSDQYGDDVDAVTLEEAGPIAEQLAHLAAEEGVLLCLSSTARSAIVEAVTGSVSGDIIRASRVPLVVVGPQCAATWRGAILAVAVDGTPPAETIVEPAVELATALGLTLRLYQVTPEDGPPLAGDVADTAYVARLARQCSRPGVTVDFDVSHSARAADVLVELSRDDEVAIIAMTTHARRPLRRLATPSALQRVLRHAACPVLVETRRSSVPPLRLGERILDDGQNGVAVPFEFGRSDAFDAGESLEVGRQGQSDGLQRGIVEHRVRRLAGGQATPQDAQQLVGADAGVRRVLGAGSGELR
jgi:nucleotide-binding universal stress UspA family protein